MRFHDEKTRLSLSKGASMNYDTSRPMVLIHGLSLTPRSWENWVAHYSAYGYRVIAPPYPA